MARFDPAESFQALKDRVQTAIQESFPQEGTKHILEVDSVDVKEDLHVNDVPAQKKAKMGGRTWGIPIHANLVLKDKKTGKVVDRSRQKVATLPMITNRYSYIVDGSEYQVDNQWRLKPGVYTKVKQNGELESFFNIKGRPFHVNFDPQEKKFKVALGGSNPPLYPIMRALGYDDAALKKQWGEDIFQANRMDTRGRPINVSKIVTKFAERLDPTATVESYDQAVEVIRDNFAETKLDPTATKRTLGKAIDRITPEAVLRSSQRLLGVSRGEEKPDVRDSLMFKTFHGIEDILGERITENRKIISRRIKNNLDRRGKIRDIVGPDVFNRPLKDFFGQSTLASTTSQTNPLHIMSGQIRTTITGEGGVKDANRITEDAKLVDPSHFGVLDSLHTPESGKTGVTLHLSIGARKQGNDVTIPLYNAKTGKLEHLRPEQVHDSIVALPDSVKRVGGKFVPKKGKTVTASTVGNEMREMSMDKVQYIVPRSSQMFSMATNLVPFISSDSPNRATMAGRQMEQAIALKEREAPLVQSALGKNTFDDLVGRFSSQRAHVDGKVVDVSKDYITILGSDRKKHRVPLYDNYPTNDKKGFLHSEPAVKVGDVVKKDQLVADTNFSRGGVYAPGTNLTTAYMPYRGYNFEDGVVLSEAAAKKLSSEHMYKKGITTTDAEVSGKKKYQAYFPTKVDKEQLEKLDDGGVAKPGQVLKPGDTIIAAMAKRELTTEEQRFRQLHKSIVNPMKDKAITWEEDVPGEVVEVKKRGRRVDVHIRTTEAAKLGDKVSNRHGGKGICTAILPDEEMPRTEDGKPVDILFNPIGLAGRMNAGQVLEVAAAKIAKKTGKPFKVANFELEDNIGHVQAALKENGIADKETVLDPTTGKKIPGVLVGPQYFLKLEHQVDKKMAARSRDSYDQNLVPKGGGPKGGQALGALGVYALLARGAKANVREMSTYKSDRANAGDNDELWMALQSGEMLPPPKPTFSYKKFESMLRAAGVNVEQDGNSLNLMPLTDKQVLEMSNGELKDAGKLIKMRTLKPEKGGLFDPEATGGHSGSKWSHIPLSTPMPNPLFEKAIMSVAGIRGPQYERLIKGEAGVLTDGTIIEEQGAKGAVYGPKSVGRLLGNVNVETTLKHEEERIPKLKGQLQNEARRRIKYLRALKKTGMLPTEAYMMNNLPVLPPNMRPVAVLDDGRLQTDDVNELYKQFAIVNKKLKEFPAGTPATIKAPLEADIYDHLKAVTGLGGTLNRKFPGLVQQIAGVESPKSGYFQNVIIKRKQDLTARSTIVPEPKLSLDEAEIPRKAAKEMYKPFLIRELRRTVGATPLRAKQMIDQGDPLAERALERVVQERPVLLKRDPVLHKYGIQAFQPKLTEGKAIKIHPLVCSGYNADFDGDQQCASVLIAVERSVYNRGISFYEPRRIYMTARFMEAVGYTTDEGELVVCNLEDFPHLPEKTTKGHIDYHPVPEGIRVVCLDEATGEPRLAPVTGWSLHRQRQIEIVTTGSGRQIITDDDERAVYGVDASSLEWCRRRPSESENQFVPIIDEAPSHAGWIKTLPLPEDSRCRLRNEVTVDFDFGYFLGALIGDDWVMYADGRPAGVVLASSYPEVAQRWVEASRSVFKEAPHTSRAVITEGKFENSCGCTNHTIYSAALARFIEPLIGRGAENKHLPPFFYGASDSFREGLLSGLFDTDGSMSWSNAKEKPQFLCAYHSTSLRLLQELQHLLRTCRVASTITPYQTPQGAPCWILSLSIVNLHNEVGVGMSLAHSEKAAALQEFLLADPPDRTASYSRYRLVPVPAALAREFRKLLGSRRDKSLYVTLSKAFDRQYMSKEAAQKLLTILAEAEIVCRHPLFEKWRHLVQQDNFHFERVIKHEVTHLREDGYDLTVPGYETFMSTDGIVLSNTMSAYVPITKAAVGEAHRMYPSRNLFSPATHEIMYTPTHEAQVGLFMLADVGKKTNLQFKTQAELAQAVKEKKVGTTDLVTVGGVKTTHGRTMLNSLLPKKLQGGKLLTDMDYQFTKKEQQRLFGQIARADKENYPQVIDAMKNHGNEHVTYAGFSFGLDDLAVHRDIRDPILTAARKKAAGLNLKDPKDVNKFLDIYEDATQKIDAGIRGRVKKSKSNLAKLEVAAGIKGRGYRQLTTAPVLFVDAKQEVVTSPVERSYSEGLRAADYWAATSGGRKGAIQKVQSVSEPGYLTKMMMNSTIDTVVTENDCKTDRGISLSIDEPDVLGRHTSADIKVPSGTIPKGTLLTPKLLDKIKNAKITKVVVRSPMRCNSREGVCQHCMGENEEGHLHDFGTNIGVLSSQALGERGTQLALKAFHTGGLFEGREAAKTSVADAGLDRAISLLSLPKKVKGSAVLAKSGGKIESITKDPAGGVNVSINGVKHYVPANRTMLGRFKVGSTVRQGDPITRGPINPHDMLPLTGVSRVQGHLAGELHQLYGAQGIRRRNSEVLVKAISSATKVADRGDHPTLLPGDFAQTNVVHAWNKKAKAKGLKPITHAPVLRGVRQIPLDVQTDWMARLNHEHLKSTLIEAAQQGWSSNLHGLHPIPPLAVGSEFGKGTKDKPWAY